MELIRGVMVVVALLGLGALGASFAGRWWAWGDSLAVARSTVGLAGLVWLVLCGVAGAMTWGWVGALWLVVLAALAPVGWAKWRPEPGAAAALVLYQKNMNFRMPSVEPLLADILEVAPDLITLQEVDAENGAILVALAERYPGQHSCDFTGVGGPAVLAKWPALETACGYGWAAMQVDHPDGAFWLVSVHLHWPAPHAQHAHLAQALPELAALDGPVFMGGDFNMVPWSGAMARVGEAVGGVMVGKARLSIEQIGGKLWLPIDHVLAPKGWAGRSVTRPQLGSDHFGVVAELVAP
ncbi:endonuclease/exonuclease/phosphatase family protein [Vannielia litorea]|uniref:endonuclease/exonuclease/phosphatase family protein n=1 Tax=Vannielia litorea TaxID=1217970 RepID=UPI001C976A7C|nr:endonuclease/exonuclease/phosphatase family protein [Vannielia litorea]MBY6152510.1 endonuclease/exonuclease/phosphatase family protein [Vannielia litorea]